ncbi:hypothetical protein SYNPS1DRAFT_28551 [Syncephalis pseudoplumigaleata]|uniref:C-CAP/cofactor C-like domain-containing protein n=1 Tax=Syncephalis pseudoplumigaleata TaxID=1712513 RepID=A0A4P9YZV4_9FUNG|nr:hypothetical protein SYNPS1DRAFT_28551 [Syncephalis pseudoplumigaleata]|eukprot:RKP25723.1 hypothetical protein SYNPS1DRAFT_28551 [Syncephalis pseudoplumigaleata]
MTFIGIKKKEEEGEEQGAASTSMSLDPPPSYNDAIDHHPPPSLPKERVLPPLPADRPSGHPVDWYLGHLRQCQIQLALAKCGQPATVRLPLERLKGVSMAGIADAANAKLKHLKRCSLKLDVPAATRCQLTRIARCHIDLAGAQLHSPSNLQLDHIKRSCIALGPVCGALRMSHIRQTTMVRSSTICPQPTMRISHMPGHFLASKLSRCTIDLRSSIADQPLSSVVLSHLSRCIVYLDRVDGPVRLERCKRCIVVMPGKQAIFRKCARIRAYVLESTTISTERTKRLQLTAMPAHSMHGEQRRDAAPSSTSSAGPLPDMPTADAAMATAMPAAPPQYHELFPAHTATQDARGLSPSSHDAPTSQRTMFDVRAGDRAARSHLPCLAIIRCE